MGKDTEFEVLSEVGSRKSFACRLLPVISFPQ